MIIKNWANTQNIYVVDLVAHCGGKETVIIRLHKRRLILFLIHICYTSIILLCILKEYFQNLRTGSFISFCILAKVNSPPQEYEKYPHFKH